MKNKKTLLLFIFIVLATSKIFSQGNLQFNQVLLLIVPQNGSLSISVPAGKVWKIESLAPAGASNSGLALRDASNNLLVYFFGASNNASLPFWLPSSFSGSFLSTGTNPYKDVISIIEFNVIP